MEIKIRQMQKKDAVAVLEMMRVFYASPCVMTDGSEEIFDADIKACLDENMPLDGYVFENDEGIKGYAMVAKSFSTEFGKPCKWLEDLYVKEDLRGKGVGSEFIRYMHESYPDSVFRLEAEEENESAVRVYKKCGYEKIGYLEMIKL